MGPTTTKFSPPPYRWKTIYHSFWVKPVIFHKWIDEDDFGDSDQLVWNKLLLSLTTQLCNLKLYTVLPFYLLVLKWILTKVLKIDCIR